MFHYFTSIYSICLVFFLLFYRNTKSSILLVHFTSHYYCNKNTAAAYNAIIPGSPNSAPVPMDKILRLTGAVIPFRIQTILIPYTIIAQKAPRSKSTSKYAVINHMAPVLTPSKLPKRKTYLSNLMIRPPQQTLGLMPFYWKRFSLTCSPTL